MKKFIIFFSIAILAIACFKDPLLTNQSAMLHIPVDTVTFDTIFTIIGSTTKNVKVYNDHNKPIKISSIKLGHGDRNFRLNINGMPGNEAKDIEIAANDSMYIFVEITIDPTDVSSPLLVHDSIIFVTNGNYQDIDLVAYGQDVHLINGETIEEDQTWSNDKPYLIINSMLVDSLKTLTIEAGVRLFFHKDSRMYVKGGLNVNGTKDEPVVFQGSRLEKMYDDVPGQWKGIWLWGGDKNHKINYAEIKNAIIGIQIDTTNAYYPTLELSNTKIEHMTSTALFAQGSKIKSTNCVFSDCGQFAVLLNIGGNYEFYHCTIANYWGAYSNRSTPSVMLNNYYLYNAKDTTDSTTYTELRNLERAYFGNCIIWGNNDNEINADLKKDGLSNYIFDNCILKADTTLNLNDTDHFKENNLVNPKGFKFIDIKEYDYQLDTLSVAKDAGDLSITEIMRNILRLDLNGEDRTKDASPDIGAYERIE